MRNFELSHTADVVPTAILRLRDIQRILSLSRGTILSRLASGDFPQPIKLGPRAIGWLQSDIDNWIASRRRARGNNPIPNVAEESQ